MKRVRVRGFLWEVVRAFQCLKVRFSAQYLADVRRKQLYKDLIDTMLPIPLYRSIYCVGSEGNVLKRVKKMSVRPSMKSFFFQLHTGTLPVKPWLQEKGIFVPWSTNCLICRKPETIDHMFLHCTDAVFHWDVLQRTLKKELPISPYGIRFLSVDSGDEVRGTCLSLSAYTVYGKIEWRLGMQMKLSSLYESISLKMCLM